MERFLKTDPPGILKQEILCDIMKNKARETDYNGHYPGTNKLTILIIF